LSLIGPDGLLKQFTMNVLETALKEEMTEHLGHEKNRAAEGRESANVRNGSRADDGADRGHRPGGDRGASGSGRHVRAGDR
jgi:transposase-like protein